MVVLNLIEVVRDNFRPLSFRDEIVVLRLPIGVADACAFVPFSLSRPG